MGQRRPLWGGGQLETTLLSDVGLGVLPGARAASKGRCREVKCSEVGGLGSMEPCVLGRRIRRGRPLRDNTPIHRSWPLPQKAGPWGDL